MARTVLTTDEIVAALKRSNLPTIICEGDNDVVVFREIEYLLKSRRVDFVPSGGRPALLEIFRRRHEFPLLPVMFVADKDMWIFDSIPTEYCDIVFTNGYSIEND